jgi:SHS2 domain-containing protein
MRRPPGLEEFARQNAMGGGRACRRPNEQMEEQSSARNQMVDARGWDHFVHGADIGVEGRGPTPAVAFEEAAVAMTAVITDPTDVIAREAVAIACEAPDLELLLVDWLNALVYEMSTRRMLFARFSVLIADGSLQATAWGEPVDVCRHHPAVEVKGATYTQLSVTRTQDGGWAARCVVDV